GEVSEACAEQVLLPRLRAADPDTAVLADGFSCRTQIHELDSGGREGLHLAELLAARLDGGTSSGSSSAPAAGGHLAGRPTAAGGPARYAGRAGAGLLAAGTLLGIVGGARTLLPGRR